MKLCSRFLLDFQWRLVSVWTTAFLVAHTVPASVRCRLQLSRRIGPARAASVLDRLGCVLSGFHFLAHHGRRRLRTSGLYEFDGRRIRLRDGASCSDRTLEGWVGGIAGCFFVWHFHEGSQHASHKRGVSPFVLDQSECHVCVIIP